MADLLDSRNLLETCIDEVGRAPVPMATASQCEDMGLGLAPPGSSVMAEESLSFNEAAMRIKQLEIESGPVLNPCRSNVNINMNNQEDVVKLTEKCLNSVSTSPAPTPLRPPEELKSNILKAQVEAGLKGSREEHLAMGDKNCNVREAAARNKGQGSRTGSRMGSTSSLCLSGRPEHQGSWEQLSPGPSDDLKAEDHNCPLSAEPITEVLSTKVKQEDLEPLVAPLTDNLIDFTDRIPVVQPKPLISPRWIIPAAAPTAVFTNGLLGGDCQAKTDPLHPEGGDLSTQAQLSHSRNVIATSTVTHLAKEDASRSKRLLTTEL